MSSETQPLNIAVIGAGIAGLVAALALHRQGHKVTVFEQSRLAKEIGAAFHITPNACVILKDLGINVYEGGAVDFRANVYLDSKTGKVVANIPKSYKFSSLPKGEDWVLGHRAHLHTQLKNATIERGIELVTAKRATSVEPEKLQINFEDGSTHTAQVIIGADGVHSKAREALFPEVHPFSTPYAAFRFMLDRADIDKHAEDFNKDILQPGTTYFWGKPDTQVLAYPTSNETQMNFVCLFPTKLLDINTEHDSQYSHKATKDQLLHVYKGFEPQILELLQMADPDQLRYWPLMDMPDLPSYVSGSVVLIGDSAHPFLPFAYQGASLAIEDGAAVGVMLDGIKKPEEIAGRLKLYEQLRHERSANEQQFSRDLFKDHSHELAWDPMKAFENIYLYRVMDEAKELKKENGFA